MSTASGLLRARTFSSLRNHRNYRLYFGGQIVSLTGTWIQNVALAWLVLELTHSPVAVGVLALCQFGPYAALGLVGGVIADRLDYRRTLIGTQTAMALCATVLAALALLHAATIWQIDLLAAVNGLVMVADTPARQAFTVQMVGRRELPNAIALNSSIFNAARIVGPAVGGVLIAAVGVGICFTLNAISFLAVIGSLLLMRPAELYAVKRDHPRVLRGIRDGLRYAWGTPQVRLVLVMMIAIATLALNFNVLLPVLTTATLHGGSVTFGVLSACFGGGALLGALLAASMGRASLRTLLTAAAGLGVCEVVLAPMRVLPVAAVLLAVLGVCFTLYTANSNSTVQLNTPDGLRGRVLSIYAYAFFGTAPLGGLLTGWLSARGGTLMYLVAAGVAVLISVAAGAGMARRRPATA